MCWSALALPSERQRRPSPPLSIPAPAVRGPSSSSPLGSLRSLPRPTARQLAAAALAVRHYRTYPHSEAKKLECRVLVFATTACGLRTSMSDTTHTAAAEVAAPQDENKLIAERREKLKALREQVKAQGGVAFPNDFKPADRAADLIAAHAGQEAEALDAAAATVSVGGRMMLKRVMGKASFATIQDATGRIQIYVTRDAVGEEVYADFKKWDLGDIIGAEGVLMKTKTGELKQRNNV